MNCGNYVDFPFKGRIIHIECVGKPNHGGDVHYSINGTEWPIDKGTHKDAVPTPAEIGTEARTGR